MFLTRNDIVPAEEGEDFDLFKPSLIIGNSLEGAPQTINSNITALK